MNHFRLNSNLQRGDTFTSDIEESSDEHGSSQYR